MGEDDRPNTRGKVMTEYGFNVKCPTHGSDHPAMLCHLIETDQQPDPDQNVWDFLDGKAVPDEAKLTDEEIGNLFRYHGRPINPRGRDLPINFGGTFQEWRAIADAATEKAWHSRDAEVAVLDYDRELAQLDAVMQTKFGDIARTEVAELQKAFELMLTNRNESNEKLDAAREQMRVLLKVIGKASNAGSMADVRHLLIAAAKEAQDG